MSSKIYFENNSRNILRYIIFALSEAYRFIYPAGAKKHLRRILLTPQSRPAATIPTTIDSETIDTDYGLLTTYSIGQGPIILFIHGWSGSGSQFFTMMETVASMGYRAITFDHYRHGHSKGKENNYPLFVKAIQFMVDRCKQDGEIVCVVSHSMGSSATLDVFKHINTPHFLIAPLFNFYEELETRVTNVGISKNFFEQIVYGIEADYKIPIKDTNPIHDISHINQPIQIVHSVDDKFALYHHSENVTQKNSNIELETLRDIGHMRIVGAPETEKALVTFLTSRINTL